MVAFIKYFVGNARLAWSALFVVCALPNIGKAKEKWDPIAAADLAATECKAYPGSDVEVLFERQTLSAVGDTQELKFYRRVKVYTAKGAKDVGIMGIEFRDQHTVWGYAAQVTKPDGSKRVYEEKDFTESTAVKSSSLKVKRLVLAVPDVVAGDVLDLAWSQTVDAVANYYRWWYCQSTVPVREFVFEVASSKTDFNMMWFNVANAKMDSFGRTSGRLVIKDLPPYEAEAQQPPERDVRGWFMLLYTNPYMRWFPEEDKFWKKFSATREEDFRLEIRPSAEIAAKSGELLKGLTTDEQKLEKLYAFCQSQIVNFDYVDSPEWQEVKKKLDQKASSPSPTQTLNLGAGTPGKINELFASLAKAAGYDVRLALSASRNSTLNVRHREGWLFMGDRLIAIKLGDGWRYYTPGEYFLPAGMLNSAVENVPALICDPDHVINVVTSGAAPDKSPVKRTGRFAVDAEGNLEGDAEISMAGHLASGFRKTWGKKPPEEVEREIRAQVTRRLAAAEVTGLQWENLKENAGPLVIRYKLKVPAYADVAGRKIIVSPGVFEHGASPIFKSENRKFSIVFKQAYKESDDIEITYPEGYTLESGSSPQNVGELNETIGVRYQLGVKPKSRRIVYKREFAVGTACSIGLKPAAYPLLKKLCDAIARSDEHTLVFKAAADSEPLAKP